MYRDEPQTPLGWVPVDGTLPFRLLAGAPLVAVASDALRHAGIRLFDQNTSFATLRETGRPLVVHDPGCPLAPPQFLAEAAALAVATGDVVVGYRPVTDTIKQVVGDRYRVTLDRTTLRAIATPVVIPPRILADLDALDPDVPRLVDTLAGLTEIRWLQAPPLARRVVDADDLDLLAAAGRASAVRE